MSIKRYNHFIKVYTKSFVDVTGARYVYPDAGMSENVEGKYVEYADYARLNANVERRTEQYNGIIDTQLKVIDELKAEVEEARKVSGAGMGVMLDLNNQLVAEVERLKAEKDQAECDYDNCQKRLVRIDDCRCDLFMENKTIKAEVDNLRKAGEAMADKIYNEGKSRGICYASNIEAWKQAKEEISRFKAEVHRLKSHSFTADELASMKAEAELLHAQFKRDLFNQMIQENERLRKAGDAMATNIPRMVTCQVTAHEAVDFMNDWNAAKQDKTK